MQAAKTRKSGAAAAARRRNARGKALHACNTNGVCANRAHPVLVRYSRFKPSYCPSRFAFPINTCPDDAFGDAVFAHGARDVRVMVLDRNETGAERLFLRVFGRKIFGMPVVGDDARRAVENFARCRTPARELQTFREIEYKRAKADVLHAAFPMNAAAFDTMPFHCALSILIATPIATQHSQSGNRTCRVRRRRAEWTRNRCRFFYRVWCTDSNARRGAQTIEKNLGRRR
jgi:hypothetical protein